MANLHNVLGVCMGGVLLAITAGTTFSLSNKLAIDKTKEEIMTTTNISEKDYSKLEARLDGPKAWGKALDSLQMDGAAKKAYLEGAQMVRDSIKTAAKSIK